ncbi:MAG: 5'/3'-nucleotidase SurE [Clostridia bacterium]|nr:5'/3'-nucleotidase SurE [Clostridia bacterium]
MSIFLGILIIMNILMTNDDGIMAEGLIQLAAELSKQHKIYVAAPNGQYSGSAHAITFFNALTFSQVDYPNDIVAYAINGTPVDCVKFGLEIIFKHIDIDLVISGINDVLNIGTDVFYSGTVNAAIEGTVCGKKSLAVSTICKDEDYSFPAKFVAENLDKLVSFSSNSVTVNINIPSNKKGNNKGTAVAELGLRHYDDAYTLISKPDEQPRYVLTGTPVSEVDSDKDHDVALSDKGYITITPLTLFTTDFEVLEKMKNEGFEF